VKQPDHDFFEQLSSRLTRVRTRAVARYAMLDGGSEAHLQWPALIIAGVAAALLLITYAVMEKS
jgi:hypothetical protein